MAPSPTGPPGRPRRVAFAVPGDLASTTGGYIYDRHLMAALERQGRAVDHVPLGASYPDPTPEDADAAARALAAIPAHCPVIVDGLALGAMDTRLLDTMTAPLVALIHHPLALETGLGAARRTHLAALERANLARAAHVLVPSPHTARSLTAEFGVPETRLTIARPGVSGMRPPHAPRPPTTPPLILSVGILVPRKGHDTLLQALARIVDRPWHAVLVGTPQDPDCADDLCRLVDALGLRDRVRIAGRIPQAELADLYASAALFALATRHEGHGLVFDEAMLHGLPIVSCAVGAVPETVATGAGLLVPPDDPAAFADALNRLLGDDALRRRMARAARDAGQALPDWDDTGRQVEAILAALEAPAHD